MSRVPLVAILLLAVAASIVAPVTPVAATEPAGPAPDLGGGPGAPEVAPPVTGEPTVVPGEVIVGLHPSAEPAEVAHEGGLAVVEELAPDEAAAATTVPAVLSTEGQSIDAALAELRADPRVAYAEPNYVVQLAEEGTTTVSTSDPMTGNQYSLDQMRVREAWAVSTGGTGVVAVLDTGVQASHPDLAGRLVAGYDFVNADSDPADDNGHGTWVAGIIAAKANDGYGIAGVSWRDRVMPVKIMTREGTGTTSNLLRGILYAADNGATVINMSVGGFPYSQSVQDAVNYAWNKGVVLVGAAGNNNRSERFYPASYANVVSVSATQVNDEFSHWSSYGPAVDVSAPGASVLTTNCYTCTYGGHDTWGSHTYISGTSFATPNVAGVVALLRARFPADTPAQIVSRLVATSDDRGAPGRDDRYGVGRVNALRALGTSVAAPASTPRDGLEPNDTTGSPRAITLGATIRPSIMPAGDVDVFAVDVPRAGRLDVRVTGVTDPRSYPWTRSSLPVDPLVELLTTGGAVLTRVDAVSEAGTELAATTVSGRTRIIVRIYNTFANGNRTAYTVTPTFVDTVAPRIVAVTPAAGSTNVSRFVAPTVRWNEAVTGVTASTVRLRDTVTGTFVAATVTYDAARAEARLTVGSRLAPERGYRVEVTAGVTDAVGNPTAATSWAFTTGVTGFSDTSRSGFQYDIAWLADSGITAGCAVDRFCPTASVTREQMASFLVRALDLPGTSRDVFTDDDGSPHENDINRLAAAGVTGGCSASRFCPGASVTREQMASFLARALELAPTSADRFTDDDASQHENDINRLAAAGVTGGCTATTFCPRTVVTREQMAAFLHRALGD